MSPKPDSKEQFIDLSACFTGFPRAELYGSGMVDVYYKLIMSILNPEVIGELLLKFTNDDKEQVRSNKQWMSDAKFGPVIKNIITLWYLGQWNQMPSHWRNRYGATALDRDHVVSAEAYRQGLIWTAMGAHPMGAKQQGYGAWTLPPPVPDWKTT